MRGFRVRQGRREWSQAEIERLAAPWAQALRAAGIRASEAVGLVFHNDVSFLVAFQAVRMLGAGMALIPPRDSTGRQRADGRAAPGAASSLAWQTGARVVLVGPGLGGAGFHSDVRVVHVESAKKQIVVRPPRAPPHAAPNGLTLFTSGTRGTPRAVVLREEVFRAHARAAAKALKLTDQDRWLATISFAHVGGLAMLLRCQELGSALVLPPPGPMSGAQLDALVREEEITHLSLVPTQLHRWLHARGDAPRPAALKAILVGGAAASPSLLDQAERAGLPVRLTYGMTETYSQVATATEDTPRASVGRPLEGVEVRIRGPDENGVGEIDVRSPFLFDQYLRAPGGSPGSRAGEWFATGDLGRLDPDGNLWITGRLGDRINTGGLKVDPAEVEAALGRLAGVRECCTLGIPDPEWGERVVAAIVAEPGANLTARKAIAHCRRLLPAYKVPKAVLLLPHLPRTSSGKVIRANLRPYFELPADSTVY